MEPMGKGQSVRLFCCWSVGLRTITTKFTLSNFTKCFIYCRGAWTLRIAMLGPLIFSWNLMDRSGIRCCTVTTPNVLIDDCSSSFAVHSYPERPS